LSDKDVINKTCYALAIVAVFLGLTSRASADDPAAPGDIRGVTTFKPGTEPLPEIQVVVQNITERTQTSVTAGSDGAFRVGNLKPGKYQLTALAEGFEGPTTEVDVSPGESAHVEFALTKSAEGVASTTAPHAQAGSLFKRLAKIYWDDWHDRSPSGPEAAYRGYPAPVTNPPFPFTVWPYGGSPVMGQPNSGPPPLMQALYNGPNGDAWKASNVQIYGWTNTGVNFSTSTNGRFANAPAAYAQISNSIQLDQFSLYIERVPDTVQTEHFDWGFRLTQIYGMDYRFTTQKGIFSNQLLGKDASYGYDPVMAYVDLYFPHVADGLNVRIGRYISLPDIEAQLAPNNYTYTHSLTYTYDCYTQDGINGTFKFGKHWLWQVGLSAGCDAAPWTSDAKLTGNTCLGYTWRNGGSEIYGCANSINDGKYAYNNLAAYYLTWYQKINAKWHMDTESWYQYMKQTPSIFGPIPAETNSNGAYCNPGQDRCFAPEWAIVNYVEREFNKKDYLSIRNEYFDDIKGQRTGYKTKYSEHMIGWGHWIGTSLLTRPEISFLHSYDMPAFSTGTKNSQFMFAGDLIWFY
jgi:hypothetical protein